MNEPTRLILARRIHDLLLHELGEEVDIALLLGPVEYARAVLSLCRACGSHELGRLADQFLRASDDEVRVQRRGQVTRYAQLAQSDESGARQLG